MLAGLRASRRHPFTFADCRARLRLRYASPRGSPARALPIRPSPSLFALGLVSPIRPSRRLDGGVTFLL
eukprot:424537-Pleurochrysis_carterae.AAC.1